MPVLFFAAARLTNGKLVRVSGLSSINCCAYDSQAQPVMMMVRISFAFRSKALWKVTADMILCLPVSTFFSLFPESLPRPVSILNRIAATRHDGPADDDGPGISKQKYSPLRCHDCAVSFFGSFSCAPISCVLTFPRPCLLVFFPQAPVPQMDMTRFGSLACLVQIGRPAIIRQTLSGCCTVCYTPLTPTSLLFHLEF